MNKTSVTALVVAAIALVIGVFSFSSVPKLGSYSPVTAGGFVTQTNLAGVNVLTALTVAGNITNCGTTGYYNATGTATLTAAQFLSVCNFLIATSSANVTTTFPAATTTYLAANSPAFGGYQIQMITNDSTNTATFVPGTGMAFKCETQGVGTTTVVGGCTSNLVTLSATSTASAIGYWDNASSSFVIMWGNQWH